MIKPEDVDEIRPGMPARVQLTGLNQRFNDPMDGTVSVVSADRIVNDKTGVASYRVDVRIAPSELRKLKKGAKMTPGMPAMVQFKTGERSVMSFLISPITQTLQDAFREE
jgi:multidrug efflux pump subunit AcrA (membrane-fusion protein)